MKTITTSHRSLRERIRALDVKSDVKSVIKEVTASNSQEESFYTCDTSDIIRKYEIWTYSLPRVKPYYAVKCNDNITVLKVLAALGTGFDCASKMEIANVLSLDVNSNRIIFANPAKFAGDIRYAKLMGVRTMTFDNEMELLKVKKLYPKAKMVIRIRCDANNAKYPMGMKFGCDPIIEAPQLLRIAFANDIDVVGVSFHVGSGCLEPVAFHRAIQTARDIFDIALTLGFKNQFNLLDIGGGYPGDHGTSIQSFADVINTSLNKYFPNSSNVHVIAEPGQFFVSSAFTLACNIHSIRTIDNGQHPQNDNNVGLNSKISGQHQMLFINDGVFGSFNCCLSYPQHTVVPQLLWSTDDNQRLCSSSIWGPTCDGIDKVIHEVKLPKMNIGDWIIFENMGAYTLSLATSFNGMPIPKVHFVADQNAWLLLKNKLPFTEGDFVIGSEPIDLRTGLDIDTINSFPAALSLINDNTTRSLGSSKAIFRRYSF